VGEIASVASFFVSRVDTEMDSRLDKIGHHHRQELVDSEHAAAVRDLRSPVRANAHGHNKMAIAVFVCDTPRYPVEG
jgi:transaldolase